MEPVRSAPALLLVLGLAASCGPVEPAAASRPTAPPYEVNPEKRPAPKPVAAPRKKGPDLYFDGEATWTPRETAPELVVTVRNRADGGPAVGPVTVSVRDKGGLHVGEASAYPHRPLPGDAGLTLHVGMPTKPPAGTLLTITVSYTNEYAEENPADNAITFKVP